MGNETGELIFLRYAHPVIGHCGRTRPVACNKSEVSPEERERFEQMLKYGGSPDRGRLEYLFPDAIKYLESWSPESIRDYWLGGKHNQVIKEADNTPLCKVYAFKASNVYAPENGEVCMVSLPGISERIKSYVNLKPGDIISVHALEVAEKLSQDTISHYRLSLRE